MFLPSRTNETGWRFLMFCQFLCPRGGTRARWRHRRTRGVPGAAVHAETPYGDQKGQLNPDEIETLSTLVVVNNNSTDQGIEMTTLGATTLEEAAKESAGNWRSFESFAWDRERALEDADDWAIFYTHNRDSDLLARSNADAIAKAMEPFTDGDDPNVVCESHSHWAVGHVDGFSIRVYGSGEITDAFRAYHELVERLADYPVLDEEAYSRSEYDATLSNMADAAWRLKWSYDLPGGWESVVFSWFREHRQDAIENRDDRGGYPEESDLRAAFDDLNYPRLE